MGVYLTEKATRKHRGDIPIALFSGFLAAIGVDACVEVFDVGEIVVSLLASALVLGLLLTPLFLIVRGRLRQRSARLLDARLSGLTASAVPLDSLDRATGLRNAAPRLRLLLEKDYLHGLSVDPDGRMLRLADHAAAPAVETQEDTASFDGVLRRIRRLNDEIEDGPVSARIERIEALTAAIFQAMRERPERAEEARKFVQYYLPTTFKLLESYSLLERQGVQGDNIRTARRGIEDALEKLERAIELQHDKLFQAEALDIESDIRVLQTMIAADGLSSSRPFAQAAGKGH